MGTCCQDNLDCDWFISPLVPQTEKGLHNSGGSAGIFTRVFWTEECRIFFFGGGGGGGEVS